MTSGPTRADLFAVTAAAGVVAVALAMPGRLSGADILLAAMLLAMTAWITWQDARTFTIPDGPLVAIALIAFAARLDPAGPVALQAALVAVDGAACGGALLVLREVHFRLRGIDGLGFGDVKLAAAAGLLLGMETFAWGLLFASLAALLAVAAAAVVTPARTLERLPFGAFLAPVCWGLWIWQAARMG